MVTRSGVVAVLICLASVAAATATPAGAAKYANATWWIVESVDYKAVAQASAPGIPACDRFDRRVVAESGTYTVQAHLRSDRSVQQREVYFGGSPRLPTTAFPGLRLHLEVTRTAAEQQRIFVPVEPAEDEDPDNPPPPTCTESLTPCSHEMVVPRKVITLFVYRKFGEPRLGLWLHVRGADTEPDDMACGEAATIAPRFQSSPHSALENRWTLPDSAARKPSVTLRIHRRRSYSYTRKEFGKARTISGTVTVDATIHIRRKQVRCRLTNRGCVVP